MRCNVSIHNNRCIFLVMIDCLESLDIKRKKNWMIHIYTAPRHTSTSNCRSLSPRWRLDSTWPMLSGVALPPCSSNSASLACSFYRELHRYIVDEIGWYIYKLLYSYPNGLVEWLLLICELVQLMLTLSDKFKCRRGELIIESVANIKRMGQGRWGRFMIHAYTYTCMYIFM